MSLLLLLLPAVADGNVGASAGSATVEAVGTWIIPGVGASEGTSVVEATGDYKLLASAQGAADGKATVEGVGDFTGTPTVTEERTTGGYGWSNERNAELQRLLWRKLRREDDEDIVEAALEGDPLPQDDLPRIRTLVERFAKAYEPNRKAQRSVEYAARAQTLLAYELALRQIAQELEDEEHALVMVLASL